MRLRLSPWGDPSSVTYLLPLHYDDSGAPHHGLDLGVQPSKEQVPLLWGEDESGRTLLEGHPRLARRVQISLP